MSIIHSEPKSSGGNSRKKTNTTSKPRSAYTKKKKRNRTSQNDDSRDRLLNFMSGWSSIAIWIGGLLIAGVYIFLFYNFFVGPYSFRWKAIYGDPPYPEGYNIRGIDISHYQTHIKWDKLRNATINNDPIRFVFIKATEGADLMDDNFNDNFFQAKENDFIRGAYHFYSPLIDARKQAEFYLHQVHLEKGDLPPVIDVEKAGKLSKQELQTSVKEWLDIVENKYHVKPIIYTGYKFKQEYLNDSVFNQYPYWIAHYYIDKLEYKGSWNFWQHTDCGKVDGIKGFVDCNIFNGSLSELLDFTLKE